MTLHPTEDNPTGSAAPPAPRPLSRRDLLRLSGAGALLPVLGGVGHALADPPPGAPAVDPLSLGAERLSWAGVRLRAANSEIYLDPLLDAAVWGEALPGPLHVPEPERGTRFVLVTHLHPDDFDPLAERLGRERHLDVQSLRPGEWIRW